MPRLKGDNLEPFDLEIKIALHGLRRESLQQPHLAPMSNLRDPWEIITPKLL